MTILEQINANPLLREMPGDNLKNPALYTYGYCYDPDAPSLMKVDEMAAPFVRYIYRQFLSGWSLSDIANALNDMEAPTPVMRKEQFGFNREHTAGYWQSCTVGQLMVNHAYIGDHVFFLPKLPRHLKKEALAQAPVPPGTVIHGHHDALVSREDYERACCLLDCQTKAFRLTRRNTRAKTKAPFSNAVICGVCGMPMTYKTYGGWNRYVCTSKRKNAEQACPNTVHPADGIIEEVTAAILMERNLAQMVAEIVKDGTACEYYRKASEALRERITAVTDEVVAQKALIKQDDSPESTDRLSTLQEKFLSLLDEKSQLLEAFTEENGWITLFQDIPDEFTFNRQLTKRLVRRVTVYPDRPCEIVFRRDKDKKKLLQYLPGMG